MNKMGWNMLFGLALVLGVGVQGLLCSGELIGSLHRLPLATHLHRTRVPS